MHGVELLAIGRVLQPAFNQWCVHFQMELQAIRIGSPTECLRLTGLGAGEVLGAIGNCKTLAMPLEYGCVVGEWGKDGVLAALIRELQSMPADLRDRMLAHGGAECMGKQLRAQADAEDRFALLEHRLDHAKFGTQVRALGLVFDIHWATQHDQPAIAIHLRLRVRLTFEIDEADPVATPPDQRIQRAQWLGSDVLEYKDAGHGRVRDAATFDYAKARQTPPITLGHHVLACTHELPCPRWFSAVNAV